MPPSPATESSAPPPANSPASTERRNFWAWVVYSFLYRVGWQFKMESTLMAGIISYLSPSPTVMGLFTALNSLGRNLSPLIASPLVDRFDRKRRIMLLLWGSTVACWGALTLFLWLPAATDRTLTLWVFGVAYTAFFTLLGAASVAQGALLGKIIPAERRGSAMAMGMGLSGAVNVGAIFLISQVVAGGGFPEPRNYALSFTFTTLFFVLAGVAILWVREEPVATPHRSFNPFASIRAFVELARADRNLGRLIAVNAAIGTLGSMLQFYTGMWRQTGALKTAEVPRALLLATVLQVLFQSTSSSYCGRLADRVGNLRVIRVLLWIEAFIPLVAWALAGVSPFRDEWGWFLGVFCLVGLRFPMYQLLVNYLLEAVPQEDHAMALGSVTVVQVVLAPAPFLLGQVATWLGYPAAMVLGSLLGVIGAYLALGLREVREPRAAYGAT